MRKMNTTTSSPHFNKIVNLGAKGRVGELLGAMAYYKSPRLFMKYQVLSLLYRETRPHIWETWLAPRS
jgi:hypothetical protein